MAFDGFKKMADGVPDYLEVPVTEDGLLEKATAAIHALGYDMEEAISIFLRRIVQTVPSAADLAQAEEFIRKTADTSLDDMVTQPLLMPKRDVFSVELLDYATPGQKTAQLALRITLLTAPIAAALFLFSPLTSCILGLLIGFTGRAAGSQPL